MTPDYNSIYENYKNSKNRTIHPFIKELYEQHMLESIKKVDSDHILATLAFTWTDYRQLYKIISYDKDATIARITPVGQYGTYRFMVYGHLLINNSSLLIEDSAIYTVAEDFSNEMCHVHRPIFISPKHKFKIYKFFPTRNKLTNGINFHFNYLNFCAEDDCLVIRLIKKDPEQYTNTLLPDNQNIIEKSHFFKTFEITSSDATTHHHIEEMLTMLFNSQTFTGHLI